MKDKKKPQPERVTVDKDGFVIDIEPLDHMDGLPKLSMKDLDEREARLAKKRKTRAG